MIRRRGFTLIELLVVVAIMAMLMAIGFSLSSGDRRDPEVRAAANELASVLRQARAMAMDRRAVHAVVFNIANPLGASGKVLSNRTGGHWYRILGPAENNFDTANNGSPTIPLPDRNNSGWGPGYSDNEHYMADRDKPVSPLLDSIRRSWVGDVHHLPPAKVRFLALNDQDNGDHQKNEDTYSATYPRPWFGWYDTASKRLWPWGGYDPQLVMSNNGGVVPRTRQGKASSHSAFYYEGDDGLITGCANPRDRWIVTDTTGDGWFCPNAFKASNKDDATKKFLMVKAGEARPVINAEWLDFSIIFLPDGSVRQGQFLWLRHEYGKWPNNQFSVTLGNQHDLAMGDMCNQVQDSLSLRDEATSYESRTSTWWMTLGPDGGDVDTFDSAREAYRSLMPAYRVGINRYGDVRVVKVVASPPAGTVMDDALTGSDWNSKSKTDQYLHDHIVSEQTAGRWGPRGVPAENYVTPEMLTDRTWWAKP